MITRVLTQFATINKRGLERFVLDNGSLVKGKNHFSLKKYPGAETEQNMCFRNSTHLLLMCEELTYFEGYIYSPKCPIPLIHSWCMDGNRLVDPTLNRPDSEYFGMPIDRLKVLTFIHEVGFYGVLANLYMATPALVELITGEPIRPK